MVELKRFDWVYCEGFPDIYGIVTRIAKDKTWADVKWSNGVSKRMNIHALVVHHTIPIAKGCTVTDMIREKELTS